MRRLVGVDADPSVGERSLGGVVHPPNRYRLTRRIRSVFGSNEDVVPPHGDDGVGLAGDRAIVCPTRSRRYVRASNRAGEATNTSLTLRGSPSARRGRWSVLSPATPPPAPTRAAPRRLRHGRSRAPARHHPAWKDDSGR